MRQFSSTRPRAEKYNKDGAYGGMMKQKSEEATAAFNRKPYYMTCKKKGEVHVRKIKI